MNTVTWIHEEKIMKSSAKNIVVFAGVAVVAVASYATGFNPIADLDAKKSRAVTANVAEFDPDADMDFDADKWGTELPDEFDVENAFASSLEKMDGCVVAHKDRQKFTEDQVLEGDAFLAVKLNPKSNRPSTINVSLPDDIRKDTKLSRCIRDVAYKVRYPKYNGPPRVVNLAFELDPGFDVED